MCRGCRGNGPAVLLLFAIHRRAITPCTTIEACLPTIAALVQDVGLDHPYNFSLSWFVYASVAHTAKALVTLASGWCAFCLAPDGREQWRPSIARNFVDHGTVMNWMISMGAVIRSQPALPSSSAANIPTLPAAPRRLPFPQPSPYLNRRRATVTAPLRRGSSLLYRVEQSSSAPATPFSRTRYGSVLQTTARSPSRGVDVTGRMRGSRLRPSLGAQESNAHSLAGVNLQPLLEDGSREPGQGLCPLLTLQPPPLLAGPSLPPWYQVAPCGAPYPGADGAVV
ncbi:hypothetical protein FDECE_8977 [Fusarium decemcellulare]|nr:hypothetical protein FDECE_8977 [Fusarium decemcellulare]